jgi:DNA-binding transcriptional regulator YiaG
MTPKQLRSILSDLGISRGGFGLMLGATRRSGENWTDDKNKEVPGPVATLAQLLKDRPELVQLLGREAKRMERRK